MKTIIKSFSEVPKWKVYVAGSFAVLCLWLFGISVVLVPSVLAWFLWQAANDDEVLKFYEKVTTTYFEELEAPALVEEDVTQPCPRRAVKFALLAQSKVGVLPASNANRMVYETVLLKMFEEKQVRIRDRMVLLGEALTACFIRPQEYSHALTVVKLLESGDIST
jgi:hypothetical protein